MGVFNIAIPLTKSFFLCECRRSLFRPESSGRARPAAASERRVLERAGRDSAAGPEPRSPALAPGAAGSDQPLSAGPAGPAGTDSGCHDGQGPSGARAAAVRYYTKGYRRSGSEPPCEVG
eukprot:289146-Hanusia_phi.AAC.3